MGGDRAALAGSAVTDLPTWWSEAGSPGFNPGLELGNSLPWVLAGHVIGGWSLVEPERAPQGLPFPGVSIMQSPLVWYDSVSVVIGEGAAWQGFGSSLATAYGWSARSLRRGAHTVLDLRNGSFEFDENSLSIERGDSLRWLRAEAVSGNRGTVEALQDAGRHLWGVAGGVGRGRHRVEASFAQRGAAASIHSGDEQVAGGASGLVAYRYRAGSLDGGVVLARGYDHHESFGVLRDASRRDAQEVRAAGDLQNETPERSFGLRAEWRRTLVTRNTDPFFERGSDAGWAAGRFERPLGDGRIRVELGAGRHAALERFAIAPAVSYRFSGLPFAGRVAVERVLNPVWADLVPRQSPFLQSTWAGILDLAVEGRGRHAATSLMIGRTRDRALVTRMPLDDLWLRLGAYPDPEAYDFALLSTALRWEGSSLGAGAEGFVLGRSAGSAAPDMDPAQGARLWGAWRFRLFHGDLGVTLRAELEGVGPRESQGAPAGVCGEEAEAPSRRLSGYATSGARMIATLAGTIITVHFRNLENRPRPEIWYDCQTGTEALAPGREFRFALTAMLLD